MAHFRWIVLFVFLNSVQCQPDSEETEDDSGGFAEPFDVPLEELKKETTRTTTLTEQCHVYKEHYGYFCERSNIAKYNEEVRILCERYDLLCRDRVPVTVDHIRRQRLLWQGAGVPKAVQKKLISCYTSCKETDPLCVNACECIFLGWIMEKECEPGVKSLSEYNCNRWFKKCKQFWYPLPNLTPYPLGVHAPPPVIRGTFFGYDGLGNSQVYNRPRDHGVSFWRGTNTVIVNWPEGKIGQATTWDVPVVGVEGVFNAWDVGFPSAASFYKDTFGPLSLNPGTGRARRHRRNVVPQFL